MPDDEDFVLNDPEHIGTGDEVPPGDSGVLAAGAALPNALDISRDGDCTVIRFNGNTVPDELCIAAYREQIFKQLDVPGCKLLRFDLTGVKILPSGMLGVLSSVKTRGFDVEVTNASQYIRDTLRMTRLDTLIQVCK